MGYDDRRDDRHPRRDDRRPRRDERSQERRYDDRDSNRVTFQAPERVVKTVREVKTKHGTRVARRITCIRCQAEDRIAFIPRDPALILCRKCAASELDIADPGANIRPEKESTCEQCGRVEMTTFIDKDPYLCRDCHRGIYSNQDDRNRRAQETSTRRVLRVRRGS